MPSGIRTVIYPVKDLVQSRRLYGTGTLLGVAPSMDEPSNVEFSLADQEIGLDPHGYDQGMTGPVASWHGDDIEASLRRLLDAGAQPRQPGRDVGRGKLIASVTDADGHIMGLIPAP